MERSRIRVVEMGNLRGLFGNKRMNKVPNEQIKELQKVTKGMNVKIGGVLLGFGHMDRMPEGYTRCL